VSQDQIDERLFCVFPAPQTARRFRSNKSGRIDPMKALVYHGPGKKALEERPIPKIRDAADAIVKITHTTICGTDLHILKGDVPTCEPGRILGHEGVGVVHEAGSAVTAFKAGDRVLVSCISSCGKCEYCRRGMYSHCTTGSWILGHRIDGTQAEYVRTPHADTSLHHIPEGADEEALVMLSDILPTGFECGVLNGKVEPGSVVAIVGAGPIGLAALLTAQFYAPAEIIMIDPDENRLKAALRFGATKTVHAAGDKASQEVMKLTHGRGVDTAIEAVGVPGLIHHLRGHRGAGWNNRQCRGARAEGGPASREAVGPQHRHHHPPRRHGDDSDAVEDRAVEEN
jgi:alcohol dehydrogenase